MCTTPSDCSQTGCLAHSRIMVAPTRITLAPMLDCFDLMAILGRQNDGQEACDTWHYVHCNVSILIWFRVMGGFRVSFLHHTYLKALQL